MMRRRGCLRGAIAWLGGLDLILLLAVLAMVSGVWSFIAIADWVAERSARSSQQGRVPALLIWPRSAVSFGGVDRDAGRSRPTDSAQNHRGTIAMGAEARIAELKLELPPAPKPVATYVTAIRHGDLLYVSGHGPYRSDGTLITGRLGETMDVAAGQAAARQTGLAILATIRAHLGSLDKVARLIKTLGMVNSTPEFHDQPKVINGYSDLMKDVFGDAGVGARSAVGMGALPGGIAVEIEAIFQVKD
jgi:enamine deaminase RidA (YjgF/YER057c/UK114 family)